MGTALSQVIRDMRDPLTRPVVRVELYLPSGEMLAREWTIGEKPPEVEMQSWMTNARRSWDHPQDPITDKADVPEDRTDEARDWLTGLERET
jgi:hypothetical protein